MAFYGKKGDRVRLVFMPSASASIPEGTEGVVVDVQQLDWGHDKFSQVLIDCDNGRKFTCVVPPGFVEIIKSA